MTLYIQKNNSQSYTHVLGVCLYNLGTYSWTLKERLHSVYYMHPHKPVGDDMIYTVYEHLISTDSSQTLPYQLKTYHHHSQPFGGQKCAVWSLLWPSTSPIHTRSPHPWQALPLPAKIKTLIVITHLTDVHISSFRFSPVTTFFILYTSLSFPDTS